MIHVQAESEINGRIISVFANGAMELSRRRENSVCSRPADYPTENTDHTNFFARIQAQEKQVGRRQISCMSSLVSRGIRWLGITNI
jgi:hypothetical protein